MFIAYTQSRSFIGIVSRNCNGEFIYVHIIRGRVFTYTIYDRSWSLNEEKRVPLIGYCQVCPDSLIILCIDTINAALSRMLMIALPNVANVIAIDGSQINFHS